MVIVHTIIFKRGVMVLSSINCHPLLCNSLIDRSGKDAIKYVSIPFVNE